eukprot:scaffold359_cov372-Pavlova_lutheri.AAC.6
MPETHTKFSKKREWITQSLVLFTHEWPHQKGKYLTLSSRLDEQDRRRKEVPIPPEANSFGDYILFTTPPDLSDMYESEVISNSPSPWTSQRSCPVFPGQPAVAEPERGSVPGDWKLDREVRLFGEASSRGVGSEPGSTRLTDSWLVPRLVPLPFTNVSCKMRWFTDPACWILPIALLSRAADAALPWVHESFDGSQPFRRSSAQRCGEVLGWDILQQYSKSQSKEDYTLWHSFFKQLCKGSYLELGALDGLRFSNSYLFSKALNWTGTLVEASPTNFKKLKANRPKDALFHNAICNSTGVVHMVDRGPVGGIYEFMPEGFRQRFHSKLDIAGLPKPGCRGRRVGGVEDH